MTLLDEGLAQHTVGRIVERQGHGLTIGELARIALDLIRIRLARPEQKPSHSQSDNGIKQFHVIRCTDR